jgi:spermidine synthase
MATLGALLAVGAFEQISQVLLVREFFVVFKGNEVSFGAVFAFWMLWTAVGSWVASLFAGKIKRPALVFCVLNLFLCACLVAEIYLVRISRGFFDVPSGAYVSIFSMALFTFVMLVGVCFVGGAQFVIGAKLYAAVRKSTGSEVPARAYIADSLGCLIGGLIVTFILVVFLDPFTSALICAAGLMAATAWLAFANRMRVMKFVAAGAAAACVLLAFRGPSFNRAADRSQWRAYNEAFELLESRNSRYGNLAVLGYRDQRSLFGNGELYFSMPDENAPTITANLFMLQHPAPKNILVVGGGISGLLRGMLRHDVERIDYVELDPEVVSVARRHLVPEDLAALENPAVHIHNTDGRLFVSRTGNRYDLIVCQLPDPSTASLNRFYTLEFFRQVRKILAEGGVFITGVSSEGFWEEQLLQRNGSVFVTLKRIFAKVLASPGGNFFAGGEAAPITLDWEELVRRFNSRGVVVPNFEPLIFYTILEPDRVQEVNEKLGEVAAGADGAAGTLYKSGYATAPLINTDSFPVSYYYNLVIWNRLSGTEWIGAFDWMIGVRTWWVLPLLGVLLLPLVVFALLPPARRRSIHAKYSVLLLMALTGLFGMVVEIALLYWFQNVYGYVYSMIGLLTAMFMLGLALGAAVSPRLQRSRGTRQATLLAGAGALAFCALVALLNCASLQLSGAFSLWLFLILNLIAGLLVGAMFRMMTFAAHELGWKPESSAGLLYGADLAGACVGSLAAGSLLIPVLGMQSTCLVAGVLLAGALAGFAFSARKL